MSKENYGLWIQVSVSARTHHKIRHLAELLHVKQVLALGYMVSLWLWAAEEASDGNLKNLRDADVAYGAQYEGKDVNNFVESLKIARLVDRNGRIHNWERHGIKLLKAAREKQKVYRENEKLKKEALRNKAKLLGVFRKNEESFGM